jgi:hypothetical protein
MDATIGNKSVAQAELPGTRASSSSGDDADRTDARAFSAASQSVTSSPSANRKR